MQKNTTHLGDARPNQPPTRSRRRQQHQRHRIGTPMGCALTGCVMVFGMACATPEGELGQTTIETSCASGDSECETARALRPLAVGAFLPARLEAIADGAEGIVLDLRPVTDKVTLDTGRMVGARPGVTGVIAEAPDGTAVDFFHVWVAVADRLALRRVGSESEVPEKLDLFAGEGANAVVGTPSHLMLDVRAFHHSQEMGGDLNETWAVTSDNPEFIIMNEGQPGQRRLLLPEDAATATVTVTGVELEFSFVVEVIS